MLAICFIKKRSGFTMISVMCVAALLTLALALGGFFAKKATVSFLAEGSRFIQMGEEFAVTILVQSDIPFNTVVAQVRFSADAAQVARVSKDNSLSLWVQEPVYSNASGTVELAGGNQKGMAGTKKIVTIVFVPRRTGEVVIDFADASILAADGKGTEILGKQRDVVFWVREKDTPAPDLNNDNLVTMADLSALLIHLGTKDPQYDLDRDGDVDIGDLSILLAQFEK